MGGRLRLTGARQLSCQAVPSTLSIVLALVAAAGRLAGAVAQETERDGNHRSETALIVGAGSGLSASLARLFVREGMAVGLAARNPDKLTALVRRHGSAGVCLRCH